MISTAMTTAGISLKIFPIVPGTKNIGAKAATVVKMAKVMGVHQERGGTDTWVSACNEGRGIYRWGQDPQEKAERGFEHGLVYRCALDFTPHWAVDQSNPGLSIRSHPTL